jgi:hypothetical protein
MVWLKNAYTSLDTIFFDITGNINSSIASGIRYRNWTLVDLSVQQSALEEIYVNLMTSASS